jgi:predicted DNA-binding transcriptional regulator YafY
MPTNKNNQKRYKLIESLLLSRKGYTAIEILEKVNQSLIQDSEHTVKKRCIYNDLEAIKNEGIEIEKLKGGRLRYTDPTDTIWKTSLIAEEKALMEIGLKAFEVFKGSLLFEKYNDIITRLMSGNILRALDKTDTAKIIQIGDNEGAIGHEWLEILYNAIVKKKTLVLKYKKYGKESDERVISPYLLKEYRNVWYLLAYSEKNKPNPGTNVFKLQRIESLTESNEEFFTDTNFDPELYFKFCLGVFHQHQKEPISVKLKATGYMVAILMEKPIHHSMEIISKNENELVVSFSVYYTQELINLILSYGPLVEVESPSNLREEIKLSIQSSMTLYL